MSKTNKVTFNMISAEMDEDLNVEVTFAGKNNEIKMNVVRRLEFDDAMMFVHDIAASCKDVAGVNFLPEVFDFAVKANTLIYYAGFEAPKEIEKAYAVIYGTNLYDVIRNEIDEEQYLALVSAAKERVNNDREIMNNTQAAKMNELIAKMDAVMNEGDSIINELASGNLQNTIENLMAVVHGQEKPEQTAEVTSNIIPLPTGGDV